MCERRSSTECVHEAALRVPREWRLDGNRRVAKNRAAMIQTCVRAIQRNEWRQPTARVVAIAATIFVLAMTACSLLGTTQTIEEPNPTSRAERMRTLREAIAADHALLEDLITNPESKAPEDLHQDLEVKSISIRLAKHEDELARLEALVDQEAP